MNIKDIMTRDVITVGKDDTVESVIKLLLDKRISGVPVVDESNKVVGIVSETDLIFRDKDISIPPFIPIFEAVVFLGSVEKFEKQIRKKVAYKVEEVMTTGPITAHEDDSVEKVANLMLTKKVNRIPIVNEEGKILGIITRSDILKSF